MDDISRLEKKLDQVLELAPIIEALGQILVQRKQVNQRVGLNKNTLNQNSKITKYEDTGERKTYIKIEDISVVRKRK